MKHARQAAMRLAFLCTALLGLAPAARADVIVFNGDTYAAIAYSPATGKIGYAYNHGSKEAADEAAVRNCKADDARRVTWVNNGFCALALGIDKSYWGVGWSYGDGASNTYAKNRAIHECNKRTSGAKCVVCLCSTNVAPQFPSTPPFQIVDRKLPGPYQRVLNWLVEYSAVDTDDPLFKKLADRVEEEARAGNDFICTLGTDLLKCESPYQIHVHAGGFFCFALTEEQARDLDVSRDSTRYGGGKRFDTAGPQVAKLKDVRIDGGRIGSSPVNGQVSCQTQQSTDAKLFVRLSFHAGKTSYSRFYPLNQPLPDNGTLRFTFEGEKQDLDDRFTGPVAAFVDLCEIEGVGSDRKVKRVSNTTGTMVTFAPTEKGGERIPPVVDDTPRPRKPPQEGAERIPPVVDDAPRLRKPPQEDAERIPPVVDDAPRLRKPPEEQDPAPQNKPSPAAKRTGQNPVVVMETSLGTIKLELYPDRSSDFVKNFLSYVNSNPKFYEGTVFHDVTDSTIQGGHFEAGMRQKATQPPIDGLAFNGLSHERGTIAMVQLREIDDNSNITARFLIHVKDSKQLDKDDDNKTCSNVFGKVIEGMDVVDKIAEAKTAARGRFPNVPIKNIVIKSIRQE